MEESAMLIGGQAIESRGTLEERLSRLEELVLAMKGAIEKLPSFEEEQNRNRTAILALYEGVIEASFKIGILRGKDGAADPK
jgi:hypothetical protein